MQGWKKDCAKMYSKCVSLLLTDALACNYNWIGSRGGKLGFKETWMKPIVLGKFILDSLQFFFDLFKLYANTCVQ